MTERRQAALYYSRKRVRSKRAVPRLFQTGTVEQGQSRNDLFDSVDFNRTISFALQVDLSSTGIILQMGSDFALQLSETEIIFTYKGVPLSTPKPSSGTYDIVIAIRPDGQFRVFTEEGLKISGESTPGPWSTVGTELSLSIDALSMLKVYTCQLPREFIGTTTVVQENDNLLFNATLITFLQGFQTPVLEDG